MKLICRDRGLGALTFVLLVALASSVSANDEGYALQPGDVLSIMTVGTINLDRAVPVEMDGTAWFPIIGAVEAAGATLGEVRRRVADAYAVTSVPASSGTETVPELIQPSQVHVGVEEYLPIYVAGEAGQSATVDFRPGLTLRQALVLAGAGDAEERASQAIAERIDAAILELAQAYGRIWSLETLLGTAEPQDYENIFVDDTQAIERIAKVERSLVEARREDLEREQRRIAEDIERTEARLAALREQRASEEEGRQLDERMVTDLRDLASQGLTPAARLAEVRRAALSSASRVLELDATIEEVESELSALRAEAETVQNEARSERLSELSETITRVHELRAELARLRSTTSAAGAASDDTVAVITRRGDTMAPVDTNSAAGRHLQPGDVVEIRRTSSSDGTSGSE